MTDFAQAPAFEQSEAIDQIATALSAAQGEMEAVSKDKRATVPMKKGGQYSFTYADLASVIEGPRAALAKHGLSVVQWPSRVQGGVEVTTQINHASGQWMRGRGLVIPCESDARSIGSAISYGRRYGRTAMVGTATEDDDGEHATKASRRAQRPEAPPLPKTNQPALVKGFRDALNIAPSVLEAYLGHSLEEITDEEAETLVAYGKAIRAGNEEAREELCGPSPAKRMREELGADDGAPTA